MLDATMGEQVRWHATIKRWAKSARAALPRGSTLPEETWRIRHRAILVVLWLHAIGIAVFGVLAGYGLLHSLTEAGLVGLIAGVAGWPRVDRRG